VEDLVHGETIDLLRMAFKTHGFSEDVPLATAADEELVITTYMLYFLLPYTQDMRSNGTSVREFFLEASTAYPGWEDTLVWVQDLKEGLRYQERDESAAFVSGANSFSGFPFMVRLAEQVIDGIGMYQNIECKMMKNMLMDLEDQERNDGRVSLTKFWGPYLADDHFFFTESPAYLKNLGALDDSDPQRPSVVVPNIIYGRSNCLGTSNGFHSLCCVNQCESIMEALERSIAQPVAPPGLITELVAALPTDTVAAPRNLSGSLRRKLDAIAAQQHGFVPLHGKMFAQWLHHAFPNECPRPVASDAAAPLTHDEWSEKTQTDSAATEQEMLHVKVLAEAVQEPSPSRDLDETALQWSEEEELVTALDLELLGSQDKHQHPWTGVLRGVLRFIAMSTAGIATLATFWDSLRNSAALLCPQRKKWGGAPAGSLPRWFSAASGGEGSKSHII